MANNLALGIVIGATVSGTVGRAFQSLDQRATQAQRLITYSLVVERPLALFNTAINSLHCVPSNSNLGFPIPIYGGKLPELSDSYVMPKEPHKATA